MNNRWLKPLKQCIFVGVIRARIDVRARIGNELCHADAIQHMVREIADSTVQECLEYIDLPSGTGGIWISKFLRVVISIQIASTDSVAPNSSLDGRNYGQ